MRRVIWRLYIGYLKVRGVRAACEAVYRCHRKLRVAIIRAFGGRVGEGTTVHGPLVIMNAKGDMSNLEIGSDAYIGPDALIDLTAPVRIGDRVSISMRATLVTHRNMGKSALKRIYPAQQSEVVIEDDAYLGAGVTVLDGVRIGRGAAVAAGAVVTEDVDAGVLAAGVPARQVKRLESASPGGSEG